MANFDFTAAVATPQYRLPTSDRQRILARSDAARLNAKIEQQRIAFMQKFGSEFGEEKEKK